MPVPGLDVNPDHPERCCQNGRIICKSKARQPPQDRSPEEKGLDDLFYQAIVAARDRSREL